MVDTWWTLRLYSFCGGWSLQVSSGTRVQEPKTVVSEGPVSESSAFDELCLEVESLGHAVGEAGLEVGEDLVTPAAQGLGEGRELGEVARVAAREEALEGAGRAFQSAGSVEGVKSLFGQIDLA